MRNRFSWVGVVSPQGNNFDGGPSGCLYLHKPGMILLSVQGCRFKGQKFEFESAVRQYITHDDSEVLPMTTPPICESHKAQRAIMVSKCMNPYIHKHILMHIHTYVYIYIYIYICLRSFFHLTMSPCKHNIHCSHCVLSDCRIKQINITYETK